MKGVAEAFIEEFKRAYGEKLEAERTTKYFDDLQHKHFATIVVLEKILLKENPKLYKKWKKYNNRIDYTPALAEKYFKLEEK